MPHIPPMMWAIIGLGIVYLLVRGWMARRQEERQAARDARMEALYAEREALLQKEKSSEGDEVEAPELPLSPSATTKLGESQPESLAAFVSDAPPVASAKVVAEEKVHDVKVRCRACRALNDEDAETCSKCGEKL